MKKLFKLLVVVLTVFGFYCGGSGNGDAPGMRLNVLKGNSAFVQSSGNLAQIGSRTSMSNAVSTKSPVSSITEVTTSEGEPVTVSMAIQVNENYVFLKGLEGGEIEPANYILDINTGIIIPLSAWPDNLKRICANSTDAFFISDGKIYGVKLADGTTTLISEAGDYYTYSSVNGYTVTSEAWGSSLMVYVDPANNLYVFGANSIIDSKVSHGQAARFTLLDGIWTTDPAFNESWFKTMPSSIPSMVPGSSVNIGQAQWLLVDQATSKIYDVHTYPYSYAVKVYEYRLDTWSDGSLAYSAALAEDSVGSTFLGFNNTFQDSIITNGAVILKLAADSCVITDVPADIPVSNSKTWPGNPEIFQFGQIANWNFLDGQLYILDPVDNSIYTWDMISVFDKSSPLQNAGNMIFLY